MATQPLINGAYTARSKIANAQRCVNLFPEINSKDAPYPTTHYLTPGLLLFSEPPVAGVARGAYTATNGVLYVAVGPVLYKVSNAGVWTSLGSIGGSGGNVRMQDNGTILFIVNGTSSGWTHVLGSGTIEPIMDGAWYGSTLADIMDQFVIFNRPDSREFYFTTFNSDVFNPLDIIGKVGYPDLLVAAPVVHREIWAIGEQTTQVFYNTGAADITFGSLPGVFIEHGCAAPYSIAKTGLQLYWVSRDKQGNGMILRGSDYRVTKVSTHAMDVEISKYPVIDDAIGFCYQQQGHVFYQLTFPSANVTWVYDVTTSETGEIPMWHQRSSIDENGNLNRHRANCYAFAYGKHIVGDYETGALYSYDIDTFTDNGTTIPRIRSFPHMKNEEKYVEYKYVIANFQVAGKETGLTQDRPKVYMRFSDDGGFSWSDYVEQDLGGVGEYIRSVKWCRLGTGRDRVFEFLWSDPVVTALNGAAIDPEAAAA